MSTRRACEIITISSEHATYLLLAYDEGGTLRVGDAEACGPFLDEREASDYLKANFSNPGGFGSNVVVSRGALQSEYRSLLLATKPRRQGW